MNTVIYKIIIVSLTATLIFGCSKEEQKSEVENKQIEIGGQPKEIMAPGDVKMVFIPGGTFEMGGEGKDTLPVHKVTITGFYMDMYEVTQKSFLEITGSNPSKFSDPQRPVDQVRWWEAIKYCNLRSEKEGLTPSYDLKTGECNFEADGYRLPTEAEWEYASRAGSKSQHFFKGNIKNLSRYAWSRKNSRDKTHVVGKKQANAFGLFDIYGNVSEWCNDNYAADYYKNSPEQDPRGPKKTADGKTLKVLRGGAWSSREKKCNSIYRLKDDPANADICQGYPEYGFRCVKNKSLKSK